MERSFKDFVKCAKENSFAWKLVGRFNYMESRLLFLIMLSANAIFLIEKLQGKHDVFWFFLGIVPAFELYIYPVLQAAWLFVRYKINEHNKKP